MWTKIAGIILRNRIAFIAGVLLGTIFMGFQARKIQMSYESADLLPKTDSAYLDYTRFRETFGQEGNVMVFAIQDSGFYQLNKTNDWIQMGNDIKALQGVNALMSITHTFNLQKNTDLKKMRDFKQESISKNSKFFLFFLLTSKHRQSSTVWLMWPNISLFMTVCLSTATSIPTI